MSCPTDTGRVAQIIWKRVIAVIHLVIHLCGLHQFRVVVIDLPELRTSGWGCKCIQIADDLAGLATVHGLYDILGDEKFAGLAADEVFG